MSPRKRSAAVAPATPRSAEPVTAAELNRIVAAAERAAWAIADLQLLLARAMDRPPKTR